MQNLQASVLMEEVGRLGMHYVRKSMRNREYQGSITLFWPHSELSVHIKLEIYVRSRYCCATVTFKTRSSTIGCGGYFMYKHRSDKQKYKIIKRAMTV